MASEPQKVIVQASRVDDSILPANISLAYRLYIIQQGGDLKNVADASNNANGLAYQATIKNEQQDAILANHSLRIKMAETRLDNHEVRISNSEGAIVFLGSRITTAENDIEYLLSEQVLLKSDIDEIKADYVSTSDKEIQSLLSPLSVTTSYSVNGEKVVGSRVTGFTAATGSALKGAFAADNDYTIGVTYSQSQIQLLAADLRTARQRIKALEDAMRSHGLID